MRTRHTAAGLLLIASACGGWGSPPDDRPSLQDTIDLDGGSDAPTAVPTGLPCNVDTILANNCRRCHSEPTQFGAPFPLVTWEHLHANLPGRDTKIYDRVIDKIDDDLDPMPPLPNARLNTSDRNVLKEWARAGAPRDEVGCGTKSSPDGGKGLSCAVTRTFSPAEAFTMPADQDDLYVCWGVDVTADTPTHIVGFGPRIDNTRITHHVVMYEAPTSYPSTPTPCSAGAALTWRMVLGWAPGVDPIELPPAAGFPIKAEGTHYVVQMHYSNVQHLADQKDTTKIDVCTTPPREFEADVAAFGTQDISIPAAPPAGGVFTRNCTVAVPTYLAGKTLFTAMPHMHQIGVSMSTTLERGATKTDLGTMSSFDFETQAWLPINAVTQRGDIIRTKCGYTNTTGKTVGFGEKTEDEMCYSFTMYYPRIENPGWSWALPSVTSKCVSEP